MLIKFSLIIFFTILIIIYFTPIFISILYSFKSDKDVIKQGPLDLPSRFTLDSFARTIKRIKYFRTLGNTLLITALSVIGAVTLGSLASYAIARSKIKFIKGMYIFFIAGILVPYQALIIPIYIMGHHLGFINNTFGVIFLYISHGLPMSIFILVGFLNTVPIQIEQAAVIDGCNSFQVYWHVVLPVLKPAIFALSVLRSLLIWNDYLLVRLFLHKNEWQTFTVRLSTFFAQYRYYINNAFAGIILASIPMIIFFLCAQKYLIKGITAGALKG